MINNNDDNNNDDDEIIIMTDDDDDDDDDYQQIKMFVKIGNLFAQQNPVNQTLASASSMYKD